MNPLELMKNWPQCASNCSAPATSVTNKCILPCMSLDWHTYLLGHMCSSHMRISYTGLVWLSADIVPIYTSVACFGAVESLRYYISAHAAHRVCALYRAIYSALVYFCQK